MEETRIKQRSKNFVKVHGCRATHLKSVLSVTFFQFFIYPVHPGDPFSVFDETKQAKLLAQQNILSTQVYELSNVQPGKVLIIFTSLHITQYNYCQKVFRKKGNIFFPVNDVLLFKDKKATYAITLSLNLSIFRYIQ